MKASLKILQRSNYKTKEGKQQVCLRYTSYRRSTFVGFNVSVHPKHWNENKKQVKATESRHLLYNQILKEQYHKAESIILENYLTPLSVSEFISRLKDKHYGNIDFYVFIDNELNLLKSSRAKQTLSNYQNLKPDLWDTKANKAVGKSIEAQKINQKLENIKTQIGKQYQKISDHDNFVSAEKVKNAYLGFGDEYRTLFSIADEFYEQYSRRVGKDRTEGSYEQLLINRRRVELFLKDRYGLSDIPIKEIEPQFIEDYYAYLLEERKLAGSTLLTSVTKLKQIMLIAQRKGYVQVNPFAGFRFKAKTRDRGYLTEDELKRFMAVELRRYKQRQIRDIFVFQAFTGLAYADVKKLTFDDIQKSFDGEMWLIAKRKKTNTTFYVKLLPVAKQLIEQYREVAKSQFIFPVPSNSGNMNLCLRRIAKICGITKRITTHSGRHSFATTVCLSQGVPIETVSQMLGHSSILTTQIYAKITNEKISKDMAILTDKIGDTYQMDIDRSQSDYRNIKRIGKKQKAMLPEKKRSKNLSILE